MKSIYKSKKLELLLFLILTCSISFGQCWSKVAVGFSHTVAIASNGTLWAWGDNSSGQLGDGTLIEKYLPVQIGTANNWVDVEAGSNFTLALRENGITGTSKTLYAWGENFYGQLGDGTNIRKTIPTQIGSPANWQQLSAGENHVIAIKATGTFGVNRYIFAWGRNNNSQLGNGTIINSNLPVQIGNSVDWEKVAAGEDFSIATKTNGNLYSWGKNDFGQLGNGTTNIVTAPTIVGSANDWLKISSGRGHVLAIKTSGALFAWGENTYQELGIGVGTYQTVPIQVGTAIDWYQVAAGKSYSLASKNGGTLFSWGYNGSGQLGIGTLITTGTRTQIGTNNIWTNQIQAGGVFATAIQSNGSLWAWGNNQAGQLGNGTTNQTTFPIVVACPASLSTSEQIANHTTFVIYPNPTSNGLISIQSKSLIKEVSAFDILGKQINVEKNNDSYKINASSGIYALSIIDTDGNSQIKKLLIN
jgi:alpha-tubulin suppressor-like RCC1 family protein